MKSGSRKILFEFFSIVIAVLLALFLTEARQNYLDKKQAKSSFRAIQQEIKDNLELIRLDSVDHLKKLEAVNRWLRTSEEHRDTVKFRLEIVHSLTKATAWEVAKLNQVVHHMPDTLVMAISRVYTMQSFYDRSGHDMYGQMTGIMASREKGQFSEGAMNAFGYEVLKEIGSVTTLKQVYEEFLAKHPIPASD